MTTPVYLPMIEEADFNSFNTLIPNDFPNDLQGWEKLRSMWLAEYPDGIEVPVKPDDFAAFVEKNCLRPDKNSLLKFSEQVATRAKIK